eukprot:6212012-Pleurochrysis_carterae.AAC.1
MSELRGRDMELQVYALDSDPNESNDVSLHPEWVNCDVAIQLKAAIDEALVQQGLHTIRIPVDVDSNGATPSCFLECCRCHSFSNFPLSVLSQFDTICSQKEKGSDSDVCAESTEPSELREPIRSAETQTENLQEVVWRCVGPCARVHETEVHLTNITLLVHMGKEYDGNSAWLPRALMGIWDPAQLTRMRHVVDSSGKTYIVRRINESTVIIGSRCKILLNTFRHCGQFCVYEAVKHVEYSNNTTGRGVTPLPQPTVPPSLESLMPSETVTSVENVDTKNVVSTSAADPHQLYKNTNMRKRAKRGTTVPGRYISGGT